MRKLIGTSMVAMAVAWTVWGAADILLWESLVQGGVLLALAVIWAACGLKVILKRIPKEAVVLAKRQEFSKAYFGPRHHAEFLAAFSGTMRPENFGLGRPVGWLAEEALRILRPVPDVYISCLRDLARESLVLSTLPDEPPEGSWEFISRAIAIAHACHYLKYGRFNQEMVEAAQTQAIKDGRY